MGFVVDDSAYLLKTLWINLLKGALRCLAIGINK